MRPPDHFETARLHLRPTTLDDAEAIFSAYAQDPDVTRYVVWRPHPDIQTTRAFLELCDGERAEGSNFPNALLRKSDGKLIGMIGLGANGVIGYVLEKPSWGQGLMTEALQALVIWAMGPGGYSQVTALCDVDNPASARVMEKAGLKFKDRLPKHTVHPNISPEPRDTLRYTITK